MTTAKQLEDAIDSLQATALRIKEQRDVLLQACKFAWTELDEVYDVDQPEPGHYREQPFSGAGEIMRTLRKAIDKAEHR